MNKLPGLRPPALARATGGRITTLDIPLLKRLVSYDPDTGKFYWLERWPEICATGKDSREAVCRAWNTRYAGTEAFKRIVNGYCIGRVFGTTLPAHRAAWALHYDEWPNVIDHINGDKADNRIINLRSVTIAENNQNKRLAEAGIDTDTGIYYNKAPDNWSAFVAPGGRYIQLGTFATRAEAVAARNGAVRCINTLRREALEQEQTIARSVRSFHEAEVRDV